MALRPWKRYSLCILICPKTFATAVALIVGLLILGSCGGEKDKKTTAVPEAVDVSGVFTEWTSAFGSYKGASFMLLDVESNVVSSAVLDDNGGFLIKSVDSGRSYYGLLLGSDFRLLGRLELGAFGSETRLPVFRLGSTLGDLGVLVAREGVIHTSQRDSLEAEPKIGKIEKEPVVFEKNLPENGELALDPDIDGEGIPNVIDGDVDGDGIPNILDQKTYADEYNENISWQLSYENNIRDFGYLSCSYLVGPAQIQHRCILQSPRDSIATAKLRTLATEVDFKRASSGSGDQVWLAEFSRDISAESLIGRLALVDATLADGSKKSFVSHLGDSLPFAFKSATVELRRTEVSAQLELTGWKDTEGTQLQVVITDVKNSRVMVFTESVSLPKTTFKGVESMFLGATAESRYQVQLRLLCPGQLPGLLGSGVESQKFEDQALKLE